MPFEDELTRLLQHDGALLYPAVIFFAAILLLWGWKRTGTGSRLSVEQRRKVKEDVVRLMRGEYRGLKAGGIGQKLGVADRDLRPLLDDLIEDRFLLTEGDAKDPTYRLRGLDNF